MKEIGKIKISRKAKELLKDKDMLKKELAKGKSAQEIIGVSDTDMAKFYQAAHFLFENRRYEGAADAFLFLATMNPYNYEYWLGLGMSLQKIGHYETAIDAYELAAICEPDMPVPYFYLAKCFFAVHENSNADAALDLALEYAADLEEYEELRQQAKKAKKLLKKK